MSNPWHNKKWVQALASLRIGNAEKAFRTIANLTPEEKPWPEWQVLALIQHRLGHAKEAAEALEHADLLAEKRMQVAVAGDQLSVPLVWDEWVQNEVLAPKRTKRSMANRFPSPPTSDCTAAESCMLWIAKPKPKRSSPPRWRVDLTTPMFGCRASRVFAKLGRIERMTADLQHAQRLQGDNPMTWIANGQDARRTGPAQARRRRLRVGLL